MLYDAGVLFESSGEVVEQLGSAWIGLPLRNSPEVRGPAAEIGGAEVLRHIGRPFLGGRVVLHQLEEPRDMQRIRFAGHRPAIGGCPLPQTFTIFIHPEYRSGRQTQPH